MSGERATGRRELVALLSAFVVVACVAVSAGKGAPALGAKRRLPPQLVGCWTRQRPVPPGTAGIPAGKYTISLASGGLLVIYSAGALHCDLQPDLSASVGVQAANLTIGPTPQMEGQCSAAGVYSWSLSGKTPSLRLVADKCRERRTFFATTWKRVPAH